MHYSRLFLHTLRFIKEDSMSASPLKLSEVHTILGGQHIHRGITFEIKKPSIVALIGGSGAGKSVLLREILGLLPTTQGSIHLLGHDIAAAPPRLMNALRNRYGVLFQNGALYSGLSVKENIAVPLVEHTRLPESDINDIVELRLNLAGLTADSLHKMPSELSGGMRKRVALARALALEPEILFLDEPTSGLDPIHARSFDVLIRSLCDNLGLTIFMITHDLDTLSQIVDRVIVLNEGTVLADGPASQVAHHPHPWIQEYFHARHA
jgi:phospholipid/cholesterol/gamma-HCH transport system ATP-binding protein